MNQQNSKTFFKSNKKYFAEVIDSNISSFLAQSWEWNFFPEFGSLLQVDTKEQTIFGIVTQIQTGSMDPMRYPFAYKKTEEELRAEQPQIFEFLKTTFKVQITGYLKENKIFYALPSKPCQIHAFISKIDTQTEISFFKNANFMYLLFSFSNQIDNLDEILIAILNHLKNKNILDNEKFDCFCKTFSFLTGNDYRRLKLFLKRIQNL
ncbi:MAG: HAS-barrel domain-containing protein [Candidatus Babeliales bacterium]